MAAAGKSTHYPPLRLTILALLIAGALTALTVHIKKDVIALNLTQDVNKALVFAGLPLVSVSFEGRDGTISGVLGDKGLPARILDIAEGVEGVRRVSNQLTVDSALGQVGSDMDSTIDDADFENGLYVPLRDHPLEKYNLSKVQFGYAGLDLLADGLPVLEQLARILQQNPQIQVELSVHTDNQGTVLGQIAASQSRADIIKYYLIEQGVNPGQMVARGYGGGRPLALNNTREGQEQNRRVEIRVLKDG